MQGNIMSRKPAVNQQLTRAIMSKAVELTHEDNDDSSVRLFELCSWCTDEMDSELLQEPVSTAAAGAAAAAREADAMMELARQVAMVEAAREVAGQHDYEVLFGDGSVGRIYGSNSAFFLRPAGAVGGVHAGVEFSEGQVVDARMDREASFERGEVLTKRAEPQGTSAVDEDRQRLRG